MPVSVFASSVSENAVNDENVSISNESQTTEKEIIVLEEDKALRDENIKHFVLSDGTKKAVVYSNAVHYKDADGNWVDIDNVLTLNGSDYSSSNKSEIKFANKSGSNGLVSIKDEEYKIDFTPKDTNKVSVVIENPQGSNSRKFEDVSKLNSLVSKAFYENIYDGVDIEYILVGNNIKENIIVKEKQDSYTFAFELKLNNLSAELVNGAIILFDYDSGENVYEIPSPYMLDASNAYSESVEYSLVQNSKWKYTLTVTANADWINADDRTFPVIIDPTVDVANNNMSDYSTDGIETLHEQNLTVGQGYASYILLSTLPVLPNDAYLTGATVSLKHVSGSEVYVGVFDNRSPNATDYCYIYSHSVETSNSDGSITVNEEFGNGGWFTWNVYEIVNSWYNNGSAGAFRFSSIVGTSKIKFAAEDAGVQTQPVIQIEYRDAKGIEDYWGYISQNVGSAGTGAVNLATGNLVFEIGTLTTSEGFFGYTPAFIYNSALAGEQYEYSNAQVGYVYGYTANGFKLNMTETIIRKSYQNARDETIYYYVWADADGTEHYFVDNENGIYYDEDGLQIYLYENWEENTCILVDANKNKKIFNVLLEENSEDEKVWYLSKIQDNSENELLFCFDGSKKPNDIKFTPKGTTQTTQLLGPLYNSSGKVALIWCNIAKEGVLFRHSDTPTGDLNPTGGVYLREALYLKCDSSVSWRNLINEFISDTDNEYEGVTVYGVMKYEYDEDGRLVSVYDSKLNYGIRYSYRENKISFIHEYTDSEEGQTIGITYHAGYTEVRISGQDDMVSTVDDIINVYLFDSYGRVVSTYSTNFERTEIYGATNGKYETENDAVKNGIKESAIIGAPNVNYFANGNFENHEFEIFNWAKNNATFEKNSNVAWDNAKAKITASTEEQSYISQIVCLSEGKYTFSLDITALGLQNSKIYLKAMYGSVEISEEIPSKELSVTGGTNFASFSFEIPESAISEGASTVNVTVGVYVQAENSQACGYIEVDNLMLTKGSGAYRYNYVNFSGINITTNTVHSTTNNWSYNEEYSESVNESYVNGIGTAIKINGNIEEERRVNQRTYIALATEVDNFFNSIQSLDGVTGITSSDMMFTVSGFGKSEYAFDNEESKFAVYVEIMYHCMDETYTCFESGCCADLGATCCATPGICNASCRQYCAYNVEKIYADFNTDNKNWQFSSNTFVLPKNSFVYSIDVGCEYTNNTNEAYFDNITLEIEKIEDSNVTVREYYANGKLRSETTGKNYVVYGYDAETGLITGIITNNTYSLYVYDNKHRVINQSTYIHNGDVQYIGVEDFNSILSSVSRSLYYTTAYEYTDYGQVKRTETKKSDNGEKIVTSYTYYDDKITSKIFGALKSETTLDNGTKTYLYNENTGLLIATIDSDGRGEGYTYDEFRRLICVQPVTYSSKLQTITDEINVQAVYGEHGLIEKIIVTDQEINKATEYIVSYNPFNQQNGISVGENVIEECEYNSQNGKLKKLIYSNGTECAYTYDKLDRISQITVSKSEETFTYEYEYDTRGNLSKLVDGKNQKTSLYKYDVQNRLIKVIEYDNEEMRNESSQSYYYNDSDLLTGAYYYSTYSFGNGSKTLAQYYSYTYNDEKTALTRLQVKIPGLTLVGNSYSVSYNYDELNRVTDKTYAYVGDSGNSSINVGVEYLTNVSNETSLIISKYSLEIMKNELTLLEKEFNYSYNDNNYILEVYDKNNSRICKYTYDSSGRLITEANDVLERLFTYSYDNNGNILTENVYDTNNALISSNTYLYNNSAWSDQLTSYNGSTITYDSMGNPILYRDGISFSWENGKELSSITNGDNQYSYEYNSQGIRISKTVNGVKHTYTLQGSKILSETYGNITMLYIYDENDLPIGISYRESSYQEDEFDSYMLVRNMQGDVIGICNGDGELVAEYTYNAWGECTVTNYTEHNIGNMNPFRYRSYYMDSETGFYYLNSRYYDPKIKRFINADDISYMEPLSLKGINLYAYCDNNPVMYIDPNGNSFLDLLKNFFLRIWEAIEIEIGVGFGWGVTAGIMEQNVSLEASRDSTIFLDDGKFLAGNKVVFDASYQDYGIGGTHIHYTDGDIDGVHRHAYSENVIDGSMAIIDCDKCEHNFNVKVIGNDDVVVQVGASVHLGVGGHVSVGFNVSEWLSKMWEDLMK